MTALGSSDAAMLADQLADAPLLLELPRPVIVACSGGADSVALLALAVQSGADVLVAHVDHGLRAGSGDEAEAVRSLAARFGVPMVALGVEVEAGPNLEARARDARYRALRSAMTAHGAGGIAVGHTADDQAETVLLNLMRGAGLAGLSGMAPVRDDIYRPLLGLRRADTEAVCAALGIVPFADPTNADPAFLRNRVRREILPLLSEASARDLVPLLARQASVMRSEHAYLDDLAAVAWPDAGDTDPEAPAVRGLVALDPVIARRAVRRWLGSPPASLDDVEAVLSVARGERVAVELSGRGRIARSGGRLYRRM